METAILKKRLNTYKTGKGKLTKVDDEVVMEVLRSWEQWQGSTKDLYRELGLSKMQLVRMIQRGKLLVKNGAFTGGEFKEIKVKAAALDCGDKIELVWDNGRQIRFSAVSQLIEFLKQAETSDNV
jgi:hypothetical protein